MRLRISTWRWVRAAAIVVTLWGGYQLALLAHGWALALLSIVLLLVFGAVVALLASPGVQALKARGVPEGMAIAAVLMGGILVLCGVGFYVGTDLVSEVRSITGEAPRWVSELRAAFDGSIGAALAARGIHVSLDSVARAGTGGGAGLQSKLPAIVASGLMSVLGLVADTVIVLVVAIWLLADGDKLERGLLGLLPSRAASALAFGFDVVQVVFGGYVRAQLFMASLIGAMAGIGTTLLGVPYAAVIGFVAGVFELVPVVGPFAGGAVAILLALTVSPWLALWTLLLFLGIHILEGYILAPRIQAHFVRAHPLIAFFALLAGFEAGGFMGALFGVPVASMLAVFVRAAADDWRRREPQLFAPPERDPYVVRRRRLLQDFSVSGPEHIARRMLRGLAMRARIAARTPPLRFLRRHWLPGVAVISLLTLILVVNPLHLAAVFRRVDPRILAVMLPVVISVSVMRGLGWWVALRHAGVEISPFRSVYIMITGKALVFVPTGDLARVALIERTGNTRDEGTVAGTITFQELLFLGLLGLGVLPRIATHPDIATLALLLELGLVGIGVLIAWRRAYEWALHGVERFRVLRRLDRQLKSLRAGFMRMLDPWNFVGVLFFNALAAGLMFVLFWLAVVAVGAGRVGFSETTFTYGLSHILSGMSLMPGGAGSMEAITTALLASKGVTVSAGAAAALLYRGYNDVVMAMLGGAAGLLVRRAESRRRRATARAASRRVARTPNAPAR